MMKMDKRTDYCGNITSKYLGQDVLLYGWVQRVRNLGQLIFIDLRDREGIVQVVVNHDSGKELMDAAASLGQEYVIEVKGQVNERASKNPDMKTGDVEVIASEIDVLNKAKTPPFEIKDDLVASEQTRLKYRYLDLRRPTLQNALILRAKIMTATNAYLSGEGFINIETPDLGKSTPEGARDYLVPSRVYPGSFYALPQSPQIFKQLLMGAGFDKYYQIARCFRDEDLRGDRQPEFTQIDLETSFMDEQGVQDVTEGLLAKVMKDVKGIDLKLPLPRITWQESMDKYGCDKPDVRYEMLIHDLGAIFANSGFKVFSSALANGGFVRGIAVKGGAKFYSRKKIDAMQDYIKRYHAKGLAWTKYEDGEFSGPVARFLSEDEKQGLIKEFGLEGGELLLFIADQWKVCCDSLNYLRRHTAKETGIIPKDTYKYLWVVDWPLFEYDEGDQRWIAAHHPFTMPDDKGIELLETDPHKAHARSYDIVLNGYELGGGSIRIHKREIQEKMFKALGFTKERAYEQFGFLMDALDMGFPPHAGLAIGLDRFAMLLAGKDNIRDVIAFPKNASASEPMMHAPSPVADQQLRELGIEVAEDAKEGVEKYEASLEKEAAEDVKSHEE
ncbi:aspartate--tRNA ligase [Lactobacillus porci]|uniref:Aspartate--tRNA ligase n=1 Tax=Lactobacillus porci TaxID=2012477 RepID=A0A6A8MEI6_9LACO|nr:aspartate--tRNA ligase [Lactobacillus porci]MDD6719327.1 aspartate--tRNA ligase [Lactobacillus porci]MST87207.1 aspartate--tRNA ligase [Lactobacillus porci]